MAILTGVFRLGRDAELRRIPSGEAVINLSLAYSYGNKDSSGNKPAQWIDGALWGKRAESLAQYLTKGVQVDCVLEDVHIEAFSKADGTPSFKLAGRVLKFDFAGGGERDAQRQSAPPPTRSHAPIARQPQPQKPQSGFNDMDDDIPF